MADFSLTSPAFEQGGMIPQKYACDGEQLSPPLSIGGAPQGTMSFVLISDDPDIPEVFKKQMGKTEFVHWVLFNIPAATTSIAENSSAGIEGQNGMGKTGYIPPCPPKEYEPSTHRYFFYLYALDAMLSLSAGAAKDDVFEAMKGHVLAQAQLMGTYRKQ